MIAIQDLEEYAVFSCVLRHENYAGDKVEQLVIMDSTETWPILGRWLDAFSTKAPEVPQKLVDDMRTQWSQAFSIENRFVLSKLVTMVSRTEIDSLFVPKDNMGWIRFRRKFPDATGIVTLSRVIFDDERKYALLYIGNQKDWLSGSGIVFFLAKSDDGWNIQTSRIVWLS